MPARQIGDDKRPNFLAFYIPLVLVAWLVNYPGRANPDTLDMLWQGQQIARLNSWHAPFVTFVYTLLDPVTGSPAGALLIQALLAMIWPALIFARIIGANIGGAARSAALLAWSLVTAALIALSGQVVKDVLLFAILSALLAALTWPPARQRLLIFSLVIAACLVRPPNFAIFAFVVTAAYLLAPWRLLPPARQTVLGALLVALATFAVAPALIPANKANPSISLYLFDLAGISASLQRNLFEELGAPQGTFSPDPWQCYTPRRSDAFMWGDCKNYAGAMEALIDKFPAAWLSAIVRHPIAYLEHRAHYAPMLFSKNNTAQNLLVPPPPKFDVATNAVGFIDFMPEEKRGGQVWTAPVSYLPFGVIAHRFFRSPLGHPLLWLGFCVAGAIWGTRQARRGNLTIVLGASLFGIGNALLFIFLGPADDIRYLLPTFLAALAVVVEELAGRHSAAASSRDRKEIA